MEPVDQLVADVQKPGECLKIILLAFDEVIKHLGIFFQASGGDNVLPFSQVGLLEILLDQQKQCGSVAQLVQRQVQENLCFEIGKHLQKKK